VGLVLEAPAQTAGVTGKAAARVVPTKPLAARARQKKKEGDN
jgi:hypothetical protein